MSDILAALPGTPMRVSEIASALAAYWQEAAREGTSSRASQMNLLMLFGAAVSPGDAAERIESALSLARRYPCRIVALCPDDAPAAHMEGKLHIACFPSPNGRERRCGEALSLGFPAGLDSAALESQASVWLESDIPTYAWLHGVTTQEVSGYVSLLKSARRIVYDGALASPDFHALGLRSDAVRDLAWARLLSVRQALGQFLGAYSPETLAKGLAEVVVRHAPARAGEAAKLSEWMRSRLEACAVRAGVPMEASFRIEMKTDCDACLSTAWRYANGDSFEWEHASQGSGARLVAGIGGVRFTHPQRVPFLEPAAALAEALFY